MIFSFWVSKEFRDLKFRGRIIVVLFFIGVLVDCILVLILVFCLFCFVCFALFSFFNSKIILPIPISPFLNSSFSSNASNSPQFFLDFSFF